MDEDVAEEDEVDADVAEYNKSEFISDPNLLLAAISYEGLVFEIYADSHMQILTDLVPHQGILRNKLPEHATFVETQTMSKDPAQTTSPPKETSRP